MGLYGKHIAICISCFLLAMCGCGQSKMRPPELDLPTASKGYVLYVFADRTEMMIDFAKRDGISRGTRLDVLRPDVPDMKGPVKLGEISVEKVGRKMSRAKVTRFTSSLKIERGDRVFPHPVLIVSDASWLTSRRLMEGWRSEHSTLDERYWETCEVLDQKRINVAPEVRQLLQETDTKPVWHPSITSQQGDVFFRKAFVLDASPSKAEMSVVCGAKANIYLNDQWVGEVEKWPEISSFKVNTFLDRGRNLVAVHATRDPRAIDPPVLFLALKIQTKFQ